MPDVRMPDGAVVRFPDNMPPEQIRGMIAAKFPELRAAAPDAAPAEPSDQSALQAALDARAAGARDQMGIAAPKGDFQARPKTLADLSRQAPPQPAQDPLGGFLHMIGIPAGQQAAAAVRGAADSATFGFGDEGAAALAVKPFDGNMGGQYDANLARIRGEQAAAQQAHPAEFLGGQAGGAVATSMMAPEVAPLRALGWAGRIAESGAVGAGYGAAYGAGSADGSPADRAKGAATGALIGGAGGLAGSGLIEAATGAGRAVASRVGSTLRGLAYPDEEAARRVAVAQSRDARIPQGRLTPQDEQTAVANGQPVYNVDRGGETTRALARSAANTSPEGRGVLTTAVNDRYDAQGQRAADTVQRIVGGNTTAGTRDQLLADARAANGPAYRKAYAAGDHPITSPELERLMTSPDVVTAMKAAATSGKSRAVADGFGGFNAAVDVTDDGRVIFKSGQKAGVPTYPNIQFWDYTYRELRSAADVAGRTGDKSRAEYLGTLARSMRSELDSQVPEYGAARSGAATAFGAQDALEAGDKFVTSRMANNEARSALGKMNPAERQLFAQGFADSLVRRIQETGDRRSVVNAIFGSQAARDRVTIALGPDRAGQMEAFLRVETLLDRARTAVTGNSTTARQLTELGLAGGIGLAASGGNVFDPKAWLTAALVRGARYGAGQIDVRVAQRVATMLASEDPALVRRGVQIVAKNNRLFDALRSADVPAAVVGSETGVRSRQPVAATAP